MLKEADSLPVVPAVISGSWRLNSLWPFTPGARVRIRFGSPIPRSPGDENEVLARVESWMNTQMALI